MLHLGSNLSLAASHSCSELKRGSAMAFYCHSCFEQGHLWVQCPHEERFTAFVEGSMWHIAFAGAQRLKWLEDNVQPPLPAWQLQRLLATLGDVPRDAVPVKRPRPGRCVGTILEVMCGNVAGGWVGGGGGGRMTRCAGGGWWVAGGHVVAAVSNKTIQSANATRHASAMAALCCRGRMAFLW